MKLFNEEFDENSIDDVFRIVSHHKSCVMKDIFRKNFKKIYDEIASSDFPDNFTFAQKIFHFLRKDTGLELGLCRTCGKRTKFLGFTKGYRPYCNSRCMGSDKNFWDIRRKTNITRYGVENPFQSEEIKGRIRETNLKKYGAEYSQQTESFKNTVRRTKLEKYGDGGFNNSKKIRETLLSKPKEEWAVITEKRKDTYRKNTGYDSPSKNPDVMESIKRRNVEKYGAEWYQKSDEARRKMSQMKKSFSRERNMEINEKRRQTCMERYGVGIISQLDEVKQRLNNTRRRNTIKKYDFVKGMDGGEFICTCTDKGCNLCEEKEFHIRRPMYRHRIRYGEELCVVKNPTNSGSSGMEKELACFIKSIYAGEVLTNDRKALGKHEIDVFVPELNVGFEFNGLYYHSELFRDKGYHQEKSLEAKSAGIRLVHIWEDDWYVKRDIVEDMVRKALGVCPNKICSDECLVKDIGTSVSRKFVGENSLYRYENSGLKFGMFHNTALVGVMAFRKSRDGYDMTNFTIKMGCSIDGGFRKMLEHFISTTGPKRVTARIPLDTADWTVCEDFGFVYAGVGQPTPTWVRESGHGKHRSGNTGGNGTYRCYDSGSIVFELRT